MNYFLNLIHFKRMIIYWFTDGGNKKNIDRPEKLATQGTQDEEKQNKNTTQYVLDTTHCVQINTNNVNKT